MPSVIPEWENLIQLDAKTWQWYLNGKKADEHTVYARLLARAKELRIPNRDAWAGAVIEDAFLKKRK